MIADPNLTFVLAMSALTGLAMLTAAALAGWRGWLAFKRQELGMRHAAHSLNAAQTLNGTTQEPGISTGATTSRIEIADLKERIRKLEAIAAGVDL